MGVFLVERKRDSNNIVIEIIDDIILKAHNGECRHNLHTESRFMKTLVGLFLIAHGLIHASYLTPKPDDPKYPFDFTKSWFANIVGDASKPLGITLALLVVVCFGLAGLGVLGVPGLESNWELLTTAGAILSTLLLVLFWHPWLALGLVINAVLLYGLHRLNWNWS